MVGVTTTSAHFISLSQQIYCHKSFSDLNNPTPWMMDWSSSIRNIVRISEVKLWLIIELNIKSSKYCIAQFHPRFWKSLHFFAWDELNLIFTKRWNVIQSSILTTAKAAVETCKLRPAAQLKTELLPNCV